MQDVDLVSRCGDCAALCCVMLPFDAGADFAIDKPAGVPCPHLARHDCRLHADLEAAGFAGCRRYDCLGAGQRVVQEVFRGKSWRDDPGLAAPMEAAFRAMRRLHEDHALVAAAARLDLTGEEASRRQALLEAIAAGARQDEARLAAYEAGPLPGAVRDFLAALRTRLRPSPPR